MASEHNHRDYERQKRSKSIDNRSDESKGDETRKRRRRSEDSDRRSRSRSPPTKPYQNEGEAREFHRSQRGEYPSAGYRGGPRQGNRSFRPERDGSVNREGVFIPDLSRPLVQYR